MKKNGNVVYIVSLVISLVISIYAIVFPEHFSRVSNAVFCFLTESFSWFYQLVMFGFVVFVLCVAFSKYGNIRLGRDDSKPDYSVFSWFAMRRRKKRSILPYWKKFCMKTALSVWSGRTKCRKS